MLYKSVFIYVINYNTNSYTIISILFKTLFFVFS